MLRPAGSEAHPVISRLKPDVEHQGLLELCEGLTPILTSQAIPASPQIDVSGLTAWFRLAISWGTGCQDHADEQTPGELFFLTPCFQIYFKP